MILSTFLLSLLQMNYSERLDAVNQLIRNMLETTTFSDVQFIIQSPSGTKSEIIDDIYKTVSRILPTSCISLNDSIPTVLPSFRASTGTLIFYAWISKNPPNAQEIKGMIDVIVHDDNRPKVLLTTIMEEEDCNFDNIFKEMWEKKIIDFMILEISNSVASDFVMRVHQYNPFTNVYDRKPYTSNIQWFPNKLTNLHGYPLKVSIQNRPGHLHITENAEGYPVTYKGPAVETLKILARAMNFSITPIPRNRNVSFLMLTATGTADLVIPMYPYFPGLANVLSEKTLPFVSESWCPVVPIKYKHHNINLRAITDMGINFIIVFLFWLLSILLKFNPNTWMLLKIFALVTSTSTSMRLKRTTEKIIFLIIILVSALYTTNLYANLTTTSLKGNTKVIYKNFKELQDSDLTPVVVDVLFDITFGNEDQSFHALKKKTVKTNSMLRCIHNLIKHKNVTCFMESKIADFGIYKYSHKGEATAEVCRNLCYAEPPIGYHLGKYSPYKDQLVEILIRVEQAGIPTIWHHIQIRKITPRQKFYIEVGKGNQSLLTWNLIYIAGCGWLVSLLVFFSEIVSHRIMK